MVRALIFAIVLTFGGGAWAQTAGEAPVETVVTQHETGRVLRQSLIVPAPRAAVWEAISTSAGLRTWAAPFVEIDLRVGGLWEASYRTDARAGDADNIHNRVIAFLPGEMLAIQAAQAPPGFPHADLAGETFAVIQLADAEGGTLVTISGLGYREGEGFDALLAFFREGNAWSLRKLRERFEKGPIDWSAQR